MLLRMKGPYNKDNTIKLINNQQSMEKSLHILQ